MIDGGDRYINLKNSINNNLKKDTIIFFDNTDRIVHGEIRKIAIESLNKWTNDKFVYTSRNFIPYNLNVTAGKFFFLSKTDFASIIGNIKYYYFFSK